MKRLIFLGLCLCFTLKLFSQPLVDDELPCQFSWAAVVPLSGGSPVNFTEDKSCQPYQGPCVAFSYIKAMEAQLNIKHNSACEVLDYSIPFLDYAAYFSPEAYMNVLNEGLGIPEAGCGIFPDECEDPMSQESDCHCIPALIKEQAIIPDLCFEVIPEFVDPDTTPEDDEDDIGCRERWTIRTSPITGSRLHATNVSEIGSGLLDINELKTKIIENGPVVLVLEDAILNDFRAYTVSALFSFHSFTIIGWEDVNENFTIWKINDHWPGDGGAFCGIGETEIVGNDAFLQFVNDDDLEIYEIDDVFIEEPDGVSGCQDAGAMSFSYADQEDCEPPFECPSLMINDIVFNGDSNCLLRNRMNSMTALVNICDDDPYEYEWIVVGGASGQPAAFDCGSTTSVIYFGEALSVTIQVRVRHSDLCEWSPWRTESFCLLLTTYYLLPNTYYLILTTYYLIPNT